jgi:hypothetical protein
MKTKGAGNPHEKEKVKIASEKRGEGVGRETLPKSEKRLLCMKGGEP